MGSQLLRSQLIDPTAYAALSKLKLPTKLSLSEKFKFIVQSNPSSDSRSFRNIMSLPGVDKFLFPQMFCIALREIEHLVLFLILTQGWHLKKFIEAIFVTIFLQYEAPYHTLCLRALKIGKNKSFLLSIWLEGKSIPNAKSLKEQGQVCMVIRSL